MVIKNNTLRSYIYSKNSHSFNRTKRSKRSKRASKNKRKSRRKFKIY